MKHWVTTNYEEFGMMSSRAGRYRHPSHANTQPTAAPSSYYYYYILSYITSPPPPPPPSLTLSFFSQRWLAIIERPGGYEKQKLLLLWLLRVSLSFVLRKKYFGAKAWPGNNFNGNLQQLSYTTHALTEGEGVRVSVLLYQFPSLGF